jgi:hypothetical protein
MTRQRRERVQAVDDDSPDPVRVEIPFEWHNGVKIHVDTEGNRVFLPGNLRTNGIYFMQSSVRAGAPPDDDACYVGRAVADAEGRVVAHLREDDKRFAANLAKRGGWVRVSLAKNIRINGIPVSEEALQDERVLEAIESAGVVDAMSYWNLQNKR